MPTIKPVKLMAQVIYFSPNTARMESATFWAAPLTPTSLPNMAPSAMMITSEPSISPNPLFTDFTIFGNGMPNSSAAINDMIKKVRNTFSLAQVISRISVTMQAIKIRITI